MLRKQSCPVCHPHGPQSQEEACMLKRKPPVLKPPFLFFDCNGLRQVFLRGFVLFSTSLFVPLFTPVLLLSVPLTAPGGGNQAASLPQAVQQAAQALVYVRANPPYGLGGTGFFIDSTTMVINRDAVMDVENHLIPPVATLSFTDFQGEVSSARAVGFVAFSHTLNLAVLKVKGYEGPALTLPTLSLEEVEEYTRHQDVYFPFLSSEGGMRVFTGQKVDFFMGLYHLNQYLPASDRKGGLPVLDSEGRLVAVSDFAFEEGVYTLPSPLLKKLVNTDFEWNTLKSLKHLDQKVKDMDRGWGEGYARQALKGDGQAAYLRGFLAYINEEPQSYWLKWLELASEQGSLLARLSLQEVLNEKEMARHLKSHAAASPQAQYRLAYFYDDHLYNDKTVISAYRKAARQGHVLARHRLAAFYDKTAQKQNPPPSRQWYDQAALQGYAPSQFMLAHQQEQEGLREDAKKWYEKAAFQGLPEAQYRLGVYYLSHGMHFFSHSAGLNDEISKPQVQAPGDSLSSFSQVEVRKFFVDAGLRWLEKAGVPGFIPAVFARAEMYRNGWGVAPDPLKASALHAVVAGQYSLPLSQAYDRYFIKKMFPRDPEAAQKSLVQYLIQLAGEDYVWASFSLGRMYEQGYMVDKSVVTARKWYRRAVSKDHVEAMYRLGETYRLMGPGGEVSWNHPQEAKKWYKKAAEKGHKNARQALQSLTTHLSTTSAGVLGVAAATTCLSLF